MTGATTVSSGGWFQRLQSRYRLLTVAATMVPTMGALVVQLAAFAITARGLGVEQFGRYAALLAIAGIGVELVGMGCGDLLVRAVARDRTQFRSQFGSMLLWVFVTWPIVVLGGTLLAVGPMQIAMRPELVALALAAEILVGRVPNLIEATMIAHEHNVSAGWLRFITAAVRAVLACIVFLWLDLHTLDEWIVAIAIQSVLLSAVCPIYAARRYGAPIWSLRTDEWRAGAAFCLNQTCRSAQTDLDRVILSRFASEAALGAYSAATRFLQIGLFPVQVMTRVLYARFFIHGQQGLAATRRFAVSVAPGMFAAGVFGGLCVAGAAMFAPQILGASFANVPTVGAQLALAIPLIALQYPAADALTGAGYQGVRAVVFVINAIGFGFVLAAGAVGWGEQGVVVAFVLGHAVLAAVLWALAFLYPERSPDHGSTVRSEAQPATPES